ncbi:Hypothetical_protein [Hexamita inflata]|uniref:Hypothetical_protein n=1 Tax=Hexamita inflata TaxID=28002 RepID=A0AA86UWV9_9EUKA|nr:Hypothetical protein HINF_LOCUS55562 [Hexamita inflata]
MTDNKIKRSDPQIRLGVVRLCNLIYLLLQVISQIIQFEPFQNFSDNLFIQIYEFYKMLDELSHITRFVLQTKTELFDNVWIPRYFCIITTEHHTKAETKFEQIAQNRNIDEQLFALASNDFSQNTDIQDANLQYVATSLQQNCIFKWKLIRLLQNLKYYHRYNRTDIQCVYVSYADLGYMQMWCVFRSKIISETFFI